jgi:hypothetical protein
MGGLEDQERPDRIRKGQLERRLETEFGRITRMRTLHAITDVFAFGDVCPAQNFICGLRCTYVRTARFNGFKV